ncbi:uncharacterized protein METZ01_LOCUS467499, partial [marine metagenome]
MADSDAQTVRISSPKRTEERPRGEAGVKHFAPTVKTRRDCHTRPGPEIPYGQDPDNRFFIR